MTYSELSAQRSQKSRHYQDDADPRRRICSATIAPLHYESLLDSGVYDLSLDLSPIPINNAQLDGWRVTSNDWHYALGKDIASHGDQDGWLGFGGRQGAHWFKFRLQRVGYLHWPTRDWQDIGGAPTYNRANLSQETRTLTIGPNDDEILVEAVASWSDIWNTPAGGALDVSWRINGDQLKEEITINQPAREWIATNRPPATPLTETWFGFAFRLDWSDIPKCVRDGVQQNINGDFSDDGDSIELRDAADRLLALLPVDQVFVPNYEFGPDDDETWPQLRKRFWLDGDGNHYLLVGVRCDVLNALPAGHLVFDPTVDSQVGASGDDATAYGASGFDNTIQKALIGYDTKVRHAFFRWTGITIAGTIDVSHIELNGDNTTPTSGSPLMKVYAVDEDNPAAPTSHAEFDADALTTASADWDASFGTGWNQSPSLNAIFQELVNTYTIDGDAVMVQVLDDGGGSNDYNQTTHYDGASADAAKLHIEYTTGAALSIPVAMHHYMHKVFG